MLRESSWGTYCGDEAVVKLGEVTGCCIADPNPCCSPVRKGKSIGSCLGATCKNFWWRLEHGWMRGKLLRKEEAFIGASRSWWAMGCAQ